MPYNSTCGPGPGWVCTTAASPGRAWASNHISRPSLGLNFRPVQGPSLHTNVFVFISINFLLGCIAVSIVAEETNAGVVVFVAEITSMYDLGSDQWRIVGSRGSGARNSVEPSAMVRPNVCQLGGAGSPRRGPGQSPGGKRILATTYWKLGENQISWSPRLHSGGSTTGPLGPGPQAPELQGAPHSQQTIFYDMIIKQTGCKRLSKQAASGPLVWINKFNFRSPFPRSTLDDR